MNTAAKGRRNEHKSIRVLEAVGYDCTRAAASKGAWDIVGVSRSGIVLVQTKSNGWPSPAEMEKLERYPAPGNATKLIHRWDDGEREPRVKVIP